MTLGYVSDDVHFWKKGGVAVSFHKWRKKELKVARHVAWGELRR
jgi:hypothetical protein